MELALEQRRRYDSTGLRAKHNLKSTALAVRASGASSEPQRKFKSDAKGSRRAPLYVSRPLLYRFRKRWFRGSDAAAIRRP